MTRPAKTPGFIVAPRRGLCLDFANTLAWRGSTPEESLHDFGELIQWCSDSAVVDSTLASRAEQWSEKHPREAAASFVDAIAIREAIYRIFFAMAEKESPEAGDVAAINRALEATPARIEVAH